MAVNKVNNTVIKTKKTERDSTVQYLKQRRQKVTTSLIVNKEYSERQRRPGKQEKKQGER